MEGIMREIQRKLRALRDATQVAQEKGDFAPEVDGLAREITELAFKKLENWIKDQMSAIEGDERFLYPVATVAVNAPLALIQLGLETKMALLRKLQVQLKAWAKG